MTGYRVAVGEDPDPLAIDAERCALQRYKQRLLVHGVIALVTVGVWLPGFVYMLLAGRGAASTWAGAYSAKLVRNTLVAGTPDDGRTVPLDTISDLSIKDGIVTVAIRGSQPLQILGLRDPGAAIASILEAREKQLSRLRGELLDEQVPHAARLQRRAGS